LILAAYYKLGNAAAEKRHPLPDQLNKIKAKDAATLLRDAEAGTGTRAASAPWSTATANSATRRARSLICS
jgi:hypothetical protein